MDLPTKRTCMLCIVAVAPAILCRPKWSSRSGPHRTSPLWYSRAQARISLPDTASVHALARAPAHSNDGLTLP
eukprot:scaffold1809_cov386-Prasinococcus_capsulatus_cf.AAC.49